MSTPYFDFKQFRIRHDRCAMKVGTDGVLLGAWATVPQSGKILDIGCGSGLISIMIAQRSQANVTGIELDKDAAKQAVENSNESPFSNRLNIVCDDVNEFFSLEKYDCIVSNPPFFNEQTTAPEAARRKARSTAEGLTHLALLNCVRRLLKREGKFSTIVPYPTAQRLISMASDRGMQLTRRTDITTRPGIPPKRSLLEFTMTSEPVNVQTDNLPLCTDTGKRTEEYAFLTRDFYL